MYERGCTGANQEAEYGCQDVKHQDGVSLAPHFTVLHLLLLQSELHFCNCHGDGCNKDWGTAASSSLPVTAGT